MKFNELEMTQISSDDDFNLLNQIMNLKRIFQDSQIELTNFDSQMSISRSDSMFKGLDMKHDYLSNSDNNYNISTI